MNKIYLHIAYFSTSKDRELSLTGDCGVVFSEADEGLKTLKESILKDIEKSFPEKKWNEPTITCLAELSEAVYYRLYPKPKTETKVED